MKEFTMKFDDVSGKEITATASYRLTGKEKHKVAEVKLRFSEKVFTVKFSDAVTMVNTFDCLLANAQKDVAAENETGITPKPATCKGKSCG